MKKPPHWQGLIIYESRHIPAIGQNFAFMAFGFRIRNRSWKPANLYSRLV